MRDPDLAKAVVALIGKTNGRTPKASAPEASIAELVQLAPSRFLIKIDRRVIKHLPGCELIPVGATAAFVALETGHGLADLALAVMERLDEPDLPDRERDALLALRGALRAWRKDRALSQETRSIVVMRQRTTAGCVLPAAGHTAGSDVGTFASFGEWLTPLQDFVFLAPLTAMFEWPVWLATRVTGVT